MTEISFLFKDRRSEYNEWPETVLSKRNCLIHFLSPSINGTRIFVLSLKMPGIWSVPCTQYSKYLTPYLQESDQTEHISTISELALSIRQLRQSSKMMMRIYGS